MRNHLVGAAVAGALLLPTAAFAQDSVDPCYADPTSSECLGVGGADGEVDADAGELDVEVRGVTATRASADAQLATTGLEVSTMVGIATGLLTIGALLMAFTKRRRSA